MTGQIPLARPDLGEREEELVLEVLRSGRLSLGPMLERFERDFAARLGVEDAVAVSSGTAALHLGVRTSGWGEGDEVLTTPLSFVATANCLLFENAKPVFCEIDPVTLNIDPGAVREARSERTAGLLPVDIFGYPAAHAELEELADGRPLLEDAAQALGSVDSEGRQAGSRGRSAAFAFYANKQMTTGEGGVLVPAGPEAAEAVRSERNQGRSPDMASVEHDRLGFNYRISEVQAAIGIAQLERLDELLAARSRAASMYGEALGALGAAPAGEGDAEGLVLPCADRGRERRSWFVYVVQLPDGIAPGPVIDALAAEGIQSKAYLPCIHLLPPYRERFGFRGGEFPVAERVARRSLALPFFGSITESQIERVVSALRVAIVREES